MSFALHPDLVPGASAMRAAGAAPAAAARGDWRTARAAGEAALAGLEAGLPEHPSVRRVDYRTASFAGAEIGMRWYAEPPGSDSAAGHLPRPAVVYLHGGGMILGSVELHDHLIAGYVADSGVPMLAVDYRLAPDHPHPAPVEDCWAGLAWLSEHGEELGVDPGRIAVMGDSGGGGLAAATALLARERGPTLSRQILIYPMLDDRNTVPDPALVPFATGWSYDSNFTGWSALLGSAIGAPEVPPTAAPSRADDLSGLPPAYIEVGELDIFRDESIDYARRLAAAGVSTELHVHPGCPHGFDRIDASADIVRRSRADRIRVLQTL